VAVLTDADFDATKIIVETVCFGDPDEPARPPTGRDCTVGNKGSSNTDADGDGDVDKKMHFESAQTGLDRQDTQGCISGFTTEGVYFEGCGPLPRG
jgi:hypothetical protein